MPRLVAQPLAAGNEMKAAAAIYLLLAVEDARLEVEGRMVLGKELTTLAGAAVGLATQRNVADARRRPNVVHGPHHWLARGYDFTNDAQRQ